MSSPYSSFSRSSSLSSLFDYEDCNISNFTSVTWPADGVVHIVDQHMQCLLQVGKAFFKQLMAGNPVHFGTDRDDPWQIIREALQDRYDCDDGQFRLVDGLIPGEVVNESEAPEATTYLFTGTITGEKPAAFDVPPLELPIAAADDERSAQRQRLPRSSSSSLGQATTSASSTRSRTREKTQRNTTTFREGVIARDSACLVTESHYKDCEAAHILPRSRPELYQAVLPSWPLSLFSGSSIFMPCYGLLLNDKVHLAYDRFEIAFKPRGDDLIVHCFGAGYHEYHGKEIPASRFRTPLGEHPLRQLLALHYRQCARMAFAGNWTRPGPA